MRSGTWLLAAALALGAAPPARSRDGQRDGEVRAQLARLALPDADARAAAERWLSANVARADYPLLAEAAAGADAEVRRRLVAVVAADVGRLDLATLFLGEAARPLQELGERGLARLALDWSRRLAKPPLVDDEAQERLAAMRRARRPRLLAIDLAAPLEETLEELDRAGALPLGVAIDPTWPGGVQAASAGPRPARGSWDELLVRLAGAWGLRLELFGAPPAPRSGGDGTPAGEASGAFLVLAPPARRVPGGTEVLVRWVRGALSDPSDAQRATFREALAALRWPAAIRWLQGSEEGALGDALLRAAASGRVPPAFARPDAVRRLVELAGAGIGAAGAQARQRGERALATLGSLPALGPAGDSTLAALLDGWDGAGARSRWVRLAAIEGIGCAEPAGAAAEAARRIDELLAAPGTPPALLLEAVRARAALRRAGGAAAAAPALGAPLALLAAVTGRAEAEELLPLLPRAGIAPPEAWRPAPLPKAAPGSPGADGSSGGPALGIWARAAALGAWLAAGEPEVAARHLLALLEGAPADGERASGERLATLLRPWALRADLDPLQRLFGAARAAAEDPATQRAVDRVALLAGELPAERLGPLLEALHTDPTWTGSGVDPALLGAVGGRVDLPGPAASAQEALLARLGEAAADPASEPPTALLDALERTLGDLYAAARDDEAQALSRRLRQRLSSARETRRRPGAGWALELMHEWPAPPREPLLPLAETLRRLPQGQL